MLTNRLISLDICLELLNCLLDLILHRGKSLSVRRVHLFRRLLLFCECIVNSIFEVDEGLDVKSGH